MGAGAFEPVEVVARLKSARASSAILDTSDAETIREVRASRLPALMLDSWIDGCEIDSVMQDGHQGGLLAARFLVSRGCRRIAWFGPTDRNAHTMDRFGGAAAGLLGEGVELPPELIFATTLEQSLDNARRMLSRPDRPEAVVALWSVHALAVKRAADELGLVIGRDLQMVGWCPEEQYDKEYAPAFAPGQAAPAVTWSIRAMAEAAVAVLAERRANPGLPPLRIRVPASLKLGR
jgi:DNA-binding LacI/PurR family transcriptional regulator